MRKIFYALMLIGFLMLSVSQIYLWRDQVEQWSVMETQIKMLERLLKLQNNKKPFVYEDEIPGNNPPIEEQDI